MNWPELLIRFWNYNTEQAAMNHSFDIITSLQYRLKAAIAEAAAFKSGKKYQDMQETHEKEKKH